MKVELDENSAVIFKGKHRDVFWEVRGHNFKDELKSSYDFKAMWATYVYLTEEMHEKFKSRINDAPWNGGQTYYRKETHEHVGADPSWDWAKPSSIYKIGDDFSHLWDESHKGDLSRSYLERHIKAVIDYLHDGEPE